MFKKFSCKIPQKISKSAYSNNLALKAFLAIIKNIKALKKR